MSTVLKGMRVVEGSAFVAVPLAGMTLAQMGADADIPFSNSIKNRLFITSMAFFIFPDPSETGNPME